LKNLLLKIEYDGTKYKGWQKQPEVTTVEKIIQQILQKICQCPVSIVACGRTDAGVHALEQVVNVKVPEQISLHKLFQSLNSLLPDDIAVLDTLQVPDLYKARMENKGKRYSYQILNSPIPKAIDHNFFLWVKSPLNIIKMKQACALFLGKHDFSAFRGKRCQQPLTVKNIYKAEINAEKENIFTKIKITIEGSGFLKNMVRIMVGTIIDIGKGKLNMEVIPKALVSGKREIVGHTAAAHGLKLEKIFFRPDPFVERKLDAWNKQLF